MKNKLKSFNRKIQKNGFFDIECNEKRNCIQLEGELDSWSDIVKLGKSAAKLGYKGVINDIRLRGYKSPEIKSPSFCDALLDGATPDVLIIGGGVIGCSIAREMSKYNLSILVVDKESDVSMHASSRNDGMIHPGIASHPGTLRGEMNVRGNTMYTNLCRELSIDFKRYGNFVLYSSNAFGTLAGGVFARREKLLGVEGRKISKSEMHRLEPNITDEASGAFEFSSSGVLSPYKLTVALAENAVENGVRFSLETIVKSIERTKDKIESVVTNRGVIHPRLVINAAGVFSDNIAQMADDRFFTIHPRKGELVILDKKKGELVERSMGLIGISQAFSDTKGGGVMRTIDGNVLVGPDAYEIPQKEDFSTHRENIDMICQKHLPLIKGFSRADVITYFAGIRAATYEEEFIVERSERVRNLVHAAGIQSPGLASAPAIAQDIVKISVAALKEEMNVYKNENFNPNRRVSPVMANLSFEEKQRVIEKHPDYGIVVCRCEGISRGEIIDCINSPIPATSLDAIKRRIRPGMGRCQGGFCSPLVTKLICEQTGIKPSQVTKSGNGSEVLK